MTMTRKRKPWVLWLLVVWMAAVISVYYVSHKPFGFSHAIGVFRTLKGLGGAGLVVALGTGVGLVLLTDTGMGPLDRLVWGSGLGLGATALGALGLGAVGLLRTWPLWILTIVGLVVVVRPLVRGLIGAWHDPRWRPGNAFQTALAVYCGLILLMGLIRSLGPPTAWDSLVYHLTGPKLYLRDGHISHPIDLPYLGFPQLLGMLFTWGIGLAGERSAAPIHWWYGVLTTVALVTTGPHHEGKSGSWLAAAIVLSGRTVAILLGWPYVDLALVFYATLAFLAVQGRKGPGGRTAWLPLTGVAIGLALSTKYTALALPVALVASMAILHLRRVGPRSGPLLDWTRDSLLVCAIAAVVWLPWLIKNLLLTGNPLYPFFLGGAHWDAWRSWWFDRPGTGLGQTAPWKLLTAPWDATVWGVEGAAGYSATIGPLYLAVIPLLLFTWRSLKAKRRAHLQAALAFVAVLYGFWLWGVARTALLRQTRLLLPAFGPLALIAAEAAEGLPPGGREDIDWRWVVRAGIALVLVLTLVSSLLSFVSERPLPVLLGIEAREDYLTRRLGWHHRAIEHLNAELGPEEAVLFLWEPRSYYCSVDCRPDALLDRWLHTIHVRGHDPRGIADAWRDQGVTHVLLFQQGLDHILEAGFDPITRADVAALETLLVEEAELVERFGSAYELYLLGGAQ